MQPTGTTDTPPPAAPETPTDIAGVIGHADRLAGAGRLAEAIQVYRNVLRRQPRLLGLHFNLGVALLRNERPQEAIGHFTTVTDATDTPDWLRLRARQALGLALEQSGQAPAAAAEYRRLLQAEPTNFGVLRQLATLYRDLGLTRRALDAFGQCHALWPAHGGIALEMHALRHAATGGTGARMDAASQEAVLQACTVLAEGVEPPPPHALMNPPFRVAAARIAPVARAHARYIESLLGGPAAAPAARPRAGRRLRLAYALPAAHDSAAAWVRCFMRHHDRTRFEVCLYTWGADDGSVERDQAGLEADAWMDMADASDAALAARLRADGIDVLLDPGCGSRRARPALFARRPAPLQLAWLADPLTAWAGWFDALVTDAAQLGPPADPDRDTGAGYAGPLCLLPQARPVPPARSSCDTRVSRRTLGLPARAPVLGLLGEPASLDADFLAAALRLVQTVPGAVLWLRDGGAEVRGRLAERAVAAGVHADQLRFAAPKDVDGPGLQALLSACDLVLDAGGSEVPAVVAAALAAGVPTLTVRSPQALQGVACSLIAAHAGPAEAVAPDRFALEAQARLLLRQPRRLLDWRRALRPGSPCPSGPAGQARGDGAALASARALEEHIERLWAATVAR